MANSTRQLKDIATALVDVAMHEKALPEVLASVYAVREALEEDRSLALSFSDSVVPLAKRRQALQEALRGHVHGAVVNAMLVLQQDDLLDETSAFAAAVASASKERAEHRRVEVTSAVELKADERHALEKALVGKFGGTIELVLDIDPKLIGGMIVNVDGWLFDGSVLGTCKRLATALAAS